VKVRGATQVSRDPIGSDKAKQTDNSQKADSMTDEPIHGDKRQADSDGAPKKNPRTSADAVMDDIPTKENKTGVPNERVNPAMTKEEVTRILVADITSESRNVRYLTRKYVTQYSIPSQSLGHNDMLKYSI
jgi:hypothetical protein